MGLAIAAYREDHNGEYPSTGQPGNGYGSLALLYPDYVSYVRLFVCPSDPDIDGQQVAAMPNWSLGPHTCSYIYNDTVKASDPPDSMVLYDKHADIHNGGRNVLLSDGRVVWVTAADF